MICLAFCSQKFSLNIKIYFMYFLHLRPMEELSFILIFSISINFCIFTVFLDNRKNSCHNKVVHFLKILYIYIYIYIPLRKVISLIFDQAIGLMHKVFAKCIKCLPMAWETAVQSQVESYQRLKKWYLIPPCLTLSITR